MAIKTIKLDTGAVYQKDPGGTYFFRYQLNGKRKAMRCKLLQAKDGYDDPFDKSDDTFPMDVLTGASALAVVLPKYPAGATKLALELRSKAGSSTQGYGLGGGGAIVTHLDGIGGRRKNRSVFWPIMTIGQTGQSVIIGQKTDLFFRLPSLADILHCAVHTDGSPIHRLN